MLIIGRERGKGPIGKIPGESRNKSGKIPGKVPKGQKRTKKEGQVQIGKPPRLKHPRLAALDFFAGKSCGKLGMNLAGVFLDPLINRVHEGVVRQHSVLRRVLRRFWEGFWGRVLRRVLRRGPAVGFTVKKGSEKGSQKGF